MLDLKVVDAYIIYWLKERVYMYTVDLPLILFGLHSENISVLHYRPALKFILFFISTYFYMYIEMLQVTSMRHNVLLPPINPNIDGCGFCPS